MNSSKRADRTTSDERHTPLIPTHLARSFPTPKALILKCWAWATYLGVVTSAAHTARFINRKTTPELVGQCYKIYFLSKRRRWTDGYFKNRARENCCLPSTFFENVILWKTSLLLTIHQYLITRPKFKIKYLLTEDVN